MNTDDISMNSKNSLFSKTLYVDKKAMKSLKSKELFATKNYVVSSDSDNANEDDF